MKRLGWILGLIMATPIMVNAQETVVKQVQLEKAPGVWIDVRSAEEFQQGHLRGAINLTHIEIAERISEVVPDKDQPIHLYCRSGRRAEVAMTELKKLGYTNVANHGGYDDLVKSGFN